jgi:isoleucyl-tRNA synthetase
MNNYRVHEATNKLIEFIVEDLSRWYLRIIRRRVWVEEASLDKEAVYTALFYALKNWLIMSSIVIPHLSEYLYQFFVKRFDENTKESVNMENWPSKDLLEKIYDKELVEAFKVARELHEMISTARMRAGLKLRKPVQKCYVFLRDESHVKYVDRVRRVLMELVNCRDIEVQTDLSLVQRYIDISLEPDLGLIGKEFKRDTPKILEYIKERSTDLLRDFLTKKEIEISIDDKKFVLRRDHVRIIEKPREIYSYSSGDLGYVVIDTRIPEEMILESLAREVIRRIQVMRKELRLGLLDQITTYIHTRGEEFIKAIETLRDYIASETRSIEIRLVSDPSEVRGELVREWDIEDEKVIIGVSRS